MVQDSNQPAARDYNASVSAISVEQTAKKTGVLVVDDEETVRLVLQAILRRRGLEVWVAAEGGAALQLYSQHRDKIALVLLDVRMPGLDGPRTLTYLQRIDPKVRCCFMSGYTGSYDPGDLLARGASNLLLKPIGFLELMAVINESVDSPCTT